MEEQILKLCKRLNKFTLENLEILSEIPKTKLLPILLETKFKTFIQYLEL